MKPVEIEYLIKNGTRATLEQISADLLKVGYDGSQSGDAISATFVRSQVQVSLLRDIIETLTAKANELRAVKPDIDMSKNIAEAEELENKIEDLKVTLKQLEKQGENTQVLPSGLPNAKRQFDGLHFSIQQMAREMPSLAMGPQMFFLAISNNLPIFTDELARAKKEYAELIATGQKGTPVWKQVVKSLFSWQTALTTGIMLLVMYGDEIVKSISDMTGWGAAKRKMREELEKSIESEKEAIKSTAKTRFELEQTIKSIKNFTGTKDEERQKIDELNSKYGESFGYYQTLSGWYDTLISKSEAYSNMLILQTKNQGLANDYIEAESKVKEIEMTPESDYDTWWGYGGKVDRFFSDNPTYKNNPNGDIHKADALKEAKAEAAKIKEQMITNNESVAAIIKDNNLNEVVAGSVEDLQNSISIRRNALIKITDPTEYKKQLAEIKKLEAEVRKITGVKALGAGDTENKAKSYERDRLSSIKEARSLELELERSVTEDKITLIELERKARINAIKDERAAYIKEHGENADVSGFDRQITAVDAQAKSDTQAQIVEDAKTRLVAMQEYFKEYGTLQQQQYAVAQEYERKIADAKTEGERRSLQAEADAYNSTLLAKDKKMNIDWVAVFGEFGSMFSGMIEPALKEAKQYLNTEDFKNADDASKQALIEAIGQMEQSLGGAGKLNFKQLGADVQAYQDSLISLSDAKLQELEMLEQLKKAQMEYEKALKNGSDTEVKIAKTNLTNAQESADAASLNVQTQTEATENFKQQMSNTATTIKGSMESITGNISKLSSGSLANAYEGIVGLMKDLSGAGSVIGEIAKKMDIPIISLILSLLDVLKDGIGDLIGGLISGILDAVSGIIEDILSLDIFAQIGGAIAKGVVDIVKSIITLGGLLHFMDDESDPDLQADIDKLTASNERLDAALDRLADKMDDAPVSEATDVYKEQLDNIKEQEKNTREMMSREGAAWARFGYGFMGLGGKGSSNSKINDSISGSEWDQISDIVGRDINGAGDFWGLSPEEMADVAEQAGWIYDKIKGYADDGHKDAAQYMDDYIAYAEEREELEKAYYEKLTGVPFDSLRDEFKNTLLDMKSDAEDFANNFEKMMQNAIIEAMMTEKYDKQLKEWYRSFGEAMEDGAMSQDERDALQDAYNKTVNDALSDRNALIDIFGWDNSSTASQSGRSGSSETMSQDQGTKLEGLFTASEMRIARIEDGVESVSTQMNTAVNHLAQIETNTGKSATSLDSLVKKIEQIIRDGLKMK